MINIKLFGKYFVFVPASGWLVWREQEQDRLSGQLHGMSADVFLV